MNRVLCLFECLLFVFLCSSSAVPLLCFFSLLSLLPFISGCEPLVSVISSFHLFPIHFEFLELVTAEVFLLVLLFWTRCLSGLFVLCCQRNPTCNQFFSKKKKKKSAPGSHHPHPWGGQPEFQLAA